MIPSRGRKRARVDESEPTVCTFAGLSREEGYADGPIADAKFDGPWGLTLDGNGNLIVTDSGNTCVRKITPDGMVSTVAGGPEQAADARFNDLAGVAMAADGTLFVADCGSHCIHKIAPDGCVITLAGCGEHEGYVDGPAVNARFSSPCGLAMDVLGFVIVADSSNHFLRKVTPDGMVSTLAGAGGQKGYVDGPVANARFSNPCDVAIGADGTVIVTDTGNHCIRKLAPDGYVSTLAGSGGQEGCVDGPVINARFSSPCGVDMDADGIVIVTDHGNHCLRKITPDGIVSTLAGCGRERDCVDGLAANAGFKGLGSVAVDADGTVIVADCDADCIRKVEHCSLSRGVGIQSCSLPRSTLASDWSHLLEEGTFADVTFAVAGAHVRAHRAVLAARSTYFRAMLQSGCKEAQPDAVVSVSDVSEAAFRALLTYVYSDRLELDDQNVMDVMCKAHEYDMRSLYTHCKRYVSHHISKVNAVAWLIAAEARGLDEAFEFSLRFVATHIRVVRKDGRDQFAGLQDHPKLMMRILEAV